MHFSDAITEYCFDCKVRKLSPKSISNYLKREGHIQENPTTKVKNMKQPKTKIHAD